MTGKCAKTLSETQLRNKVCHPPVESRHCYISCYATEQPASLLRWFEVNAVTPLPAQPAGYLIGLTSPLLSFPVCFLAHPDFPCFPALSVISHHPLSVVWWNGAVRSVLMEAAAGHAGAWTLPWGCRCFYPSLLPLSDRFLAGEARRLSVSPFGQRGDYFSSPRE